jgi:glycosyltransferase involved in cell wall biosynthesis
MRVLQLISQTVIGGAETFGFSLSAELARRGHDVLLLANRANGRLFERERPPRLTVRALNRTSRLDPHIVSFLFGAIREFRPDVLHAHNFGPNTWARSLGLAFPRLTVVCHEHSGRKAHQSRHRIWLDRLLYKHCAAVFAVSSELGRLLARRYGIGPKVLHVLPNGIDTEGFRVPTDVTRDPFEMVIVASLTDVKNHLGLLRAFRRVAAEEPRARLTIVGDGPLREELMRFVNAEQLHDQVRFAGAQMDVRPHLWKASIFVLFSHREAMPLSLLEGMAAGCACVAPAVGEIPSMVGSDAGRLVSPGDEEGLARVLLELLRAPGQRATLGGAGRGRVEKSYSLRACVDVIESVYAGARR